MTDADLELVAALAAAEPPLHVLAEAILDARPKWSSAQLRDALELAGHALPKVRVRELRDAWAAARKASAPASDDIPAAEPTPEQTRDLIRARMLEATKVGDSVSAYRWAAMLARLDGQQVDGAPDELDPGWERLSASESAALRAILAKLHGAPVDGDAAWWLALIARAPDVREVVHPAHVPLPPDTRKPRTNIPG